jgi:hypothetical protein
MELPTSKILMGSYPEEYGYKSLRNFFSGYTPFREYQFFTNQIRIKLTNKYHPELIIWQENEPLLFNSNNRDDSIKEEYFIWFDLNQKIFSLIVTYMQGLVREVREILRITFDNYMISNL